MDKIKSQWRNSLNYLELGTYSKSRASFYSEENRLIKIISLFSYFMVVIFSLGLFSYSAYLKDHGGVIVNITAPFEHWGVTYQALRELHQLLKDHREHFCP